jgi:endoglucanase
VRGDDATQLAIYKEQFPYFWEHPSVKGITLWGYVENEMWRNEAYLLSSEGVERPALQWLRSYITGDSTQTYQLTLSSGGNGSVSASPSQSTYVSGTQITVTATADEGYSFDKWSGDFTSTSNPFTFNIIQNTQLEAVFVEETSDTTATPCENPVGISLPFSFDGAGEFCWETEGAISYINSWNLENLVINGTDYTNTYSTTLPETINGKYYFSYTGLYAWSHLEIAASLKSTTIPKVKKEVSKTTSVWPNPFSETIYINTEDPDNIEELIIYDKTGKELKRMKPQSQSIQLSSEFAPGYYFITLKYSDNTYETFKIFKN